MRDPGTVIRRRFGAMPGRVRRENGKCDDLRRAAPREQGPVGEWSHEQCYHEHFLIDGALSFRFFAMMNATMTRRPRWCWRKDLAEFRGLTERERTGFLLVLE